MFTTPTLKRVETISLAALIGGVLLLLCGSGSVVDSAASSRSGLAPLAPLLLTIGGFLLSVALIFYVIFLIFTLMRDHETWKRSLDE
jgi:uncharacterized BrkB/YihY/UPF0761 family membrane protein